MKDKYTIQPIEETRATIFDTSIDLSMDISEIYLDMLSSDGVIKDIPALGTVYKIGKLGYSVGQLAFIKKTLIFAQEMQRKNVGSDVLEKHKQLMVANPKKYYKELELIIEYLNRQVGYEKSVLNARIYYMYLEGQLDYEDFVLLLETVDQIHLMDIETLISIYKKGFLEFGEPCSKIACIRLSSCALVEYYNGISVRSEGDGRDAIVRIMTLGKIFCAAVLCIAEDDDI